MREISFDLENCYGIKELKQTVSFGEKKTVLVYAPNGTMKSSLAKTFSDISEKKVPCDRIHKNRITKCKIKIDGNDIAIVDVVGGTVDVATFYKYISKEEGTQVECISQKVESLGVESLINTIANNADSEEDREQIREYLIETTMNYNNDDHSIRDLKSPYINRHSLYMIRKQF